MIKIIFKFFNEEDNFTSKVQSSPEVNDVYYKGEDLFTDLDWIIQKSFEKLMNKLYPEIKVVGEEDTKKDIKIGGLKCIEIYKKID